MSAICINGRSLSQTVTGVQRYLTSILVHLPKDWPILREETRHSQIGGHWWEQANLPRTVGDRLLWSPANTGPLIIRRQIVTIHDAATLDHPEWFDPKFAGWYRALLPVLSKNCLHVVTVSEFSKRRLAAKCGISEKRISVVPCGVGEVFRQPGDGEVYATLLRYGVGRQYFLYVGSLEPRKNLPTLLSAWKSFAYKQPNHELLLVGGFGGVFNKTDLSSLPQNVRCLGRVPDECLAPLYANALAVICPSFYEGFGLPPLEAMSAGGIVVASDIDAHREVLGDTALYFPVLSAEALSAQLSEVIKLSDLQRSSMVAAGMRRSADYKWSDAATRLAHVLNAFV